MNRSFLFGLAFLLLVSFSAAAAGTVEPGTTMPWASGSQEAITLTGNLILEDAWHPELKVDGVTWELMYPRWSVTDLSVENGTTITVTGYEVPGPRWEASDSERHLMVQKAVIDGKEYVVPPDAMGPMGGRGRGMMENSTRGRTTGPRWR